MKFKQTYTFIIGLCIFFACKKEKPPIPPLGVGSSSDHCPEMYEERSNPLSDTVYKGDIWPFCPSMTLPSDTNKYSYSEVVVNPNNRYEIAYLRQENDNAQFPELCIYNFCNNQLNVIETNVFYSIDWGTNDWIVYTGEDQNIWKIKSNGQGLTQLTTSGSVNNSAKWSLDGERILYSSNNDYRIMSSNGENLSNLGNLNDVLNWNWLNNDELVYTQYGTSSIQTYNLETENNNELIVTNLTFPGETAINVFKEKIYFDSREGIHILENGSVTTIDSNYVTFSALSPAALNEELILVTRYIRDTTGYSGYCQEHYQSSYLSLIQVDNEKERIIKEPN